MKIKYSLVLTMLLSLGFLSSCDKDDDPEVENMATYPVSGDWYVNYEVETSPGVFEDIYGVGPTHLLVYNTAANTPDEIWIDDQGNFWNYKVKTGVNMQDLTFSANEAVSASMQKNQAGDMVPYDIKVNITDGKVFKDATKAHGVQIDSIYFNVSFEDDAEPFGTVYRVTCHRSTGFE